MGSIAKMDSGHLLEHLKQTVIPKLGDCEYAAALTSAIIAYETGDDFMSLTYLLMLKRYPVGIRQFCLEAPYLNMGDTVYDFVLNSVEELNNPLGNRMGLQYYEAVFTGGIGTAKTTRALITTAYQLYLLSCFHDPHKVLGQDKSSEILFIFQSLSAGVAMDVDYKRFRTMIENSEYFNTTFPYRKDLASRLVFPHRIEARPVSGEVTATIGQNVFGGVLDEVNFMHRVESSKKSLHNGTFDQARELYNSISSRRASRFMDFGITPGILCMVSSKNYPGQFTDMKRDEAKTDKGIYYADDRVWEVKPDDFTDARFQVFPGDAVRKPFLLSPEMVLTKYEQLQLISVPYEFLNKFKADIYVALREVAAVSTMAKNPYIPNVEAVSACFGKVKSILSTSVSDFRSSTVQILKHNIQKSLTPRYAHIDLAKTGDAAGVVIGHVKGFELVNNEGMEAYFPTIRIDCTLRVPPPPNDEINFAKIRKIIVLLNQLGANIKWVSFDSYQSVDSQQILRTHGLKTGTVSMDTTSVPYDTLKTAMYEGRVLLPEDDFLLTELIQLERNTKGKIDHPPQGSKDVADALAGVVFGLTTRAEIWALHGVPVNQSLVSAAKKMKAESEDTGSEVTT